MMPTTISSETSSPRSMTALAFFPVSVPALTAARVPVEGIGLLLAVDAIPDMVRTTANVTGAMTLAAIARRRSDADHGRA